MTAFETFAELRDLPVNVTALFGSADAARSAPRGDIVLGFDAHHGLVRNVDFDESRLDYDETYENSQAFSPTFREFQTALAHRLVDTYDLEGGDIVEIGSGKGEFLTEFAGVAGGRGYGFDPSYGGQADDAAGERVTFVVDRYDERHVDQPADLVACRHVLEHLDDPAALLASLRRVLDGRPDTIVYFEVPNLVDILDGGGMWDVIYQHVWYFGAPALEWLFEGNGFEVLDVRTPFGGAFLSVEARVGEPQVADRSDEVAKLAGLVDSFAGRLADRRAHWARELGPAAANAGQSVALWGAGAKGVTFLNAVDGGADIDVVVDVNPRKHGSFVPGTGQPIVSPDEAVDRGVDRVLIMNPNYRDEIGAALAERGSAATVEVV